MVKTNKNFTVVNEKMILNRLYQSQKYNRKSMKYLFEIIQTLIFIHPLNINKILFVW